MKKALSYLCLIALGATALAADNTYMERFQTYQNWSQNLPTHPEADFFSFIESDTPLAKKLRRKWLYQLAYNKDWATFNRYYQGSDDITLQCYALTGLYHQGNTQEALDKVKPLWLSGDSQPKACDELFEIFIKSTSFTENLLTQRIKLALENRNLSLARHLLKQYKPPRIQDANTLTDIYFNPTHITQLPSSDLQGDFYLYGLKRLVSINIDKAIEYWNNPLTKKILNQSQQQAFFTHLAVYKAIRNHDDAPEWFAKIQPRFYSEPLLGWQIRYALKLGQWQEVERLIQQSKDKDNPTWQYWLARALIAQGKKDEGRAIYTQLAKTRNYYGFLASLKLHKNFSFEHEPAVTDLQRIQPYKPFIDQISSMYYAKQIWQASSLLNDFVLELPREDKSALIYWLATHLKWHGKAIYLSSNDELNNQLLLRFPLAYKETIKQYAKSYQIPPQFIYAIIRQESTFRDDVISPAGAYGLMQVMPATAKAISQREHINFSDKTQLFSAQKNINIGVAYLQHLAKRFNQHPVLIAAAYNAGPRQVVYWMKNHPPRQVDIWIETLPWPETRNYLKNIIAFYTVYQYLLNQKPDLKAFMNPIQG